MLAEQRTDVAPERGPAAAPAPELRAERGGRVKRARSLCSLVGGWARLTRLAALRLRGSEDRLAPVCPPRAGHS